MIDCWEDGGGFYIGGPCYRRPGIGVYYARLQETQRNTGFLLDRCVTRRKNRGAIYVFIEVEGVIEV